MLKCGPRVCLFKKLLEREYRLVITVRRMGSAPRWFPASSLLSQISSHSPFRY
jgi:hypothetical protein